MKPLGALQGVLQGDGQRGAGVSATGLGKDLVGLEPLTAGQIRLIRSLLQAR